ncbi:MAG: lamin tail domain-containing protein, partial [Planctomycetota bacterium]
MASNSSVLIDGFGDDSDWIEIRNDAETPIDLIGYHLTDNASNTDKWQFPVSRILDPGDYLVVFASGRDVVDPAGHFHTNFGLDPDGEYLALTAPDRTVLSEFGSSVSDYPPQISNISYGVSGNALVDGDSVTQYLIPGDDGLGNTWIENGFDGLASGFSLGRAAMGYENSTGSSTSYASLIQTTVPSGTTTVYQRIEFELDDASAVDDLQLRAHFDDGMVAFLNGVEVASFNAPNPLTFDAIATDVHPDETAIAGRVFDLDAFAGLLVDGTNTLAIQMLNRFNTSSDFLMVPVLSTQSILGPDGHLVSPTPGANNSRLLDVGPLITQVTTVPSALAGDSLTITAHVSDFTSPVDANTVRLHYRRMYAGEVTLAMVDDGTGDDSMAGDGVFTATIPGSTFVAGEMVRWYVTATDTVGIEAREPRFLDAIDSPQYLGTVVADPGITTDLQTMFWFVENPGAAQTNAGTRASISIDGVFYDNVQVDGHGQSTRGSAFPKKSFDFDANSGFKFRVRPDLDPVSDFNLLTNYADQTKLRNTLQYGLFAEAGHSHHYAFPVMVYRNGSFYALYDIIEEGDSEYLERLGEDPDNPLYKVNNRVNHAYNNVEKKTREYEDHSDFADVVDAAVNLSGTAATTWDYDNLDIAELVNYLAIQNVTSANDFGHKNMYWYRDTNGTQLWSVFPWDQDLSLGHQWDASVSPPYFKDDLVTQSGIYSGGGNEIFPRLYSDPDFREMHARRIRSLSDQFYGLPGTPAIDSHLGQEIVRWESLIADEAIQNMNAWGIHPNFTHTPAEAAQQLLDEYIPQRRTYLDNHPDVPDSQVQSPTILFDDVDFDADPISGLQTEEYVRLNNPNTFAVDLSQWELTGGIEHRFKSGTVIPSGGSLYVVKDVLAFKSRASGPSGGQRLLIQGNYNGQLTFTGETVDLVNRQGELVDSLQTPVGEPTQNQQFLRVTEIHYHPDVPDTEFIELTNTSGGSSATTLDLSGVSIVEGPSSPFVIPAGTSLAPEARLVIAKDSAALLAAHPSLDPLMVLGDYHGQLSNGGERIKIIDAGTETIFDVDYNDSDPWPIAPDGTGASLVLIDAESTPFDELAKPYHYRGSAEPGGTPGQPSNARRGIVINELLTHTDDPQVDAIELFNSTTSEVDLSGWYLSDSGTSPLKFRIPDGTQLGAGEYIVFDENDFNPTPTTPAPNHFALSGSNGDEVWLVIPDASEQVVAEFVDEVSFGASFNGQTFGLLPDSRGRLVPQVTPTLGFKNEAHLVSEVVITEVQYNSDSPTTSDLALDPNLGTSDLEFVELHNHSDTQVNLTNWRLRGDADFDFAPGTSLDADEVLVLVQFDPAEPSNTPRLDAFRNHYGIDASVRLAGPLQGTLGNSFGRVRLQKPDAAPVDDPTTLPHVVVDEVYYDDRTPWPVAADGEIPTLQRVSEFSLGNSAESWFAVLPTPGSTLYRPHVESISLNGGDSQRSLLTEITVQFDREVDLENDPIQILHREQNQLVQGLLFDSQLVDGKTVLEIQFGDGPFIEPRTAENSLVDGNYELTV